ncbi:MAG: hypothetical protein EOO28_30400 [Comamonadaceae bacterium]|nr:MAG: hypothetical protein EOO28_30400 [Comamonadaceae bacterium]
MPRYEERPFSRETNDDELIWKIAIGVFVGILAAALVTYWVRMYFIQQALQDFNKSIQQISVQSQRSTQELQKQQALRQQQAVDAANQRKLDIANAQRQAEEAKRAQLAEVARREAAWAKYYKKPAQCDSADGQAFVDCANGHIRAKRRFEELYASGKYQ